MTRETLIQRTLSTLSKLPQEKVIEIADFAEYIQKKYDEELIQEGIHNLISNSKVFEYLSNEKDIYTVNDLKESYK